MSHASKTVATLLLACSAIASAAPAEKPRLILCINEGAQDQQPPQELIDKYEPLSRAIEEALSVKVTTLPFLKNAGFAEQLPSGRCDVVFGKSMNILSYAVATMGYQPVVKDSAPYRIGFISGQKLGTLADLQGTTITLPPPDTYVSTLAVRALIGAGLRVINEETLITIRDTPADVPGTDLERFKVSFANYDRLRREHVAIKHIRYIGAVTKTAAVGANDVGAINPQLLKSWPKDKPVLLMPPTLGWSVLANPKMPEAQVKALQAKLVTIQGPALKQMWLTGSFVPATVGEMKALDDYLRPAREALLRRPGVTVAGR